MSDYTKTLLMNALTLIATFLTAYGITLTQGQIQQIITTVGIIGALATPILSSVFHNSAVIKAVAAAPGTSLTTATKPAANTP
jgi:hypothetical protein